MARMRAKGTLGLPGALLVRGRALEVFAVRCVAHKPRAGVRWRVVVGIATLPPRCMRIDIGEAMCWKPARQSMRMRVTAH